MELLVMRKDRRMPGNPKDARMFKRGDVMVAMPDGHSWGRLEHPATDPDGTYFLIRVPGMTIEEAEVFMEEEVPIETDPEKAQPPPGRRRVWSLDESLLTGPQVSELNRLGVTTATPEQMTGATRRKP